MHPEIENLINMALADGEVKEKERAIILRKAEALGVDKDEVELILDGKIAMMKKEQASNYSVSKSNKEGDLKKCPSCGAPVESFNTKCKDCGHEFRNIKAVSSIQKLNEELQEAAARVRKEKENIVVNKHNSHLKHPLNISKEIYTLQSSIISAFPVPNTKEDLLEFISVSLAGANIKTNKIGGWVLDGSDMLKNAWLSKSKQVIIKARFALKDDKNSLDQIEYYANQLKLTNSGCLGLILGPFMKIIQGGK